MDNIKTVKLSVAIQLVNKFTQLPASIGKISFSLNGKTYTPIRKKSAYFIFINLPAGIYHLTIDSEMYFLAKQKFEVNNNNSTNDKVSQCFLTPRPSYPFSTNATLIRGKVVQTDTIFKPLGDVTISANYIGSDGKNITVQTVSADSGSYMGQYAISLQKNSKAKPINFIFNKSGYIPAEKTLNIDLYRTTILNQQLSLAT